MPALTRHRDPDAEQETWQIYYGDVRVGTISERFGNPTGASGWQWACGFDPGRRPTEHAKGAAKTFDEARRAFEIAWRYFLAKLTEADFAEYRRSRAFHTWKETMWEAGLKLPTQVADGQTICFCGAAIGIADFEQHVYAAHMEPKAE
jgi:predicted GIY-YIG superfamily endonuclease